MLACCRIRIVRGHRDRAPNPFFSSIALEHLIVARGTTACCGGTVWVDKRGWARSGSLNAYAAAMGCRFLLGRSRRCSGGAKNNCGAKRKFHPDQHFRLLVWGSSLLRLRAHRCACLLRGPAHGPMPAMPYRKGHQSARQYSHRRKTGGGSNAHERARRHGPAVSCRTLGVLSFGWTRQRAEPGTPMKRRAFVSLVGATMVTSKQG